MRKLERWRGAASLVRGRGLHLGDLPELLSDWYGNRTALEEDGAGGAIRWSFDDIATRVAHLGAAHAARGHLDGRRVAIAIANRADTLLHVLALARLGATAILINPRLRPSEIAAVFAATHPDAAVVDPSLAAIPKWQHSLSTGIEWCLDRSADDDSVESWMLEHPLARAPTRARDRDEPPVLFCTSGTTGVPKAAALTGENLLAAIGRMLALPVGFTGGFRANRDAVLSALPLAHVMGFSSMLGSWCAGVPVVHRERFDANDILSVIEQRQPNAFIGVPTMYADLEEAGAARRDLSSVQLWISAADVLPPDRARRFQTYGAIARVRGRNIGTAALVDVYGMVELSGPAAVRVYPPSPTRNREVPAVSFALPGFELRAIDEHGAAMRWGTTGRLQVRGRGVFRGYEGGSTNARDGDGWFDTSDFATVWPGGFVTVSGRDRDRLKVAGFSVFPAEVESTLRTYAGVDDVALVGVPDARLGEKPVALVVARDKFDPERFRAWAETDVAGYRRPRDVIVVAAIPRGPNGKVDRAAATRLARERVR